MDAKAGRTWHLFLDESGTFDTADDDPAPACVAGVIVQESSLEGLRTALRSALSVALPTIPYPPHASHARFGSYHLAAWMMASADSRSRHISLDRHSESRLDRAEKIVRANELRVGFRELLDAVSAGKMPGYDVLAAADRTFAAVDASALDALRAETGLYGQRLCELLGFFRERYGAGRFAPIAAVTFEAFEGKGPNSYLRATEVLLERVIAFLRARPPASHTVWVHPANRKVTGADLLRVWLRPFDVAQTIRAAERFPLDPPEGSTDPHVRLLPDMPSNYREHTHPGIALADFVANRVFAAVQHAVRSNKPWHAIARDLSDRTGLTFAVPVACVGGEFTPSIASVGPAAEAIRAHWSPPRASARPYGDIESLRPRWVRDQAAAWARLAVRVP